MLLVGNRSVPRATATALHPILLSMQTESERQAAPGRLLSTQTDLDRKEITADSHAFEAIGLTLHGRAGASAAAVVHHANHISVHVGGRKQPIRLVREAQASSRTSLYFTSAPHSTHLSTTQNGVLSSGSVASTVSSMLTAPPMGLAFFQQSTQNTLSWSSM